MADLHFDEEPEAQLTRREEDPTLAVVFRAVDEKLVLLEEDPSNSAVRPRRFTNGLWCVIAYNAGDVAVRYLGPRASTDVRSLAWSAALARVARRAQCPPPTRCAVRPRDGASLTRSRVGIPGGILRPRRQGSHPEHA